MCAIAARLADLADHKHRVNLIGAWRPVPHFKVALHGRSVARRIELMVFLQICRPPRRDTAARYERQ
jgi:hypothetical protein